MKWLHKFTHGLGDACQYTAVLKHLPDIEHHVAAYRGKHTAFPLGHVLDDGLPQGEWDRVIDQHWPECWSSWNDSPGTKTALCLREQFGIVPQWDLMRYEMSIGPEATARAEEYVKTLPDKPFVLLHYQGNTSQGSKDLKHRDIQLVCDWLNAEGFIPVILDWDHRTPLPDGMTVFNPEVNNPIWQRTGTGDAETIAALCKLAKAAVMIDSGPQKCAFATDVPTVAVWTGHHPYHYADNAPNAVHLVPPDHVEMIRGDRSKGLQFFLLNYKYVEYPKGKVANAIKQQLAAFLGINYNPMSSPELLTATAYDQQYYDEHREAGLDYLGHGEWQENYGRWLVDSLGLEGKTVLDVGCACGSIAAGIAKAGALVSGVDCNEHMINLGRQHWLASTLKVCDTTNLHYWRDETFTCIHSNNVFEHLKPKLVPFILEELHRVTKAEGILFAVLDTEELYQRQKRELKHEDPTHICVKPMAWWEEQLAATGWVLAPDLFQALSDHPGNYFRSYDWPCIVARKV